MSYERRILPASADGAPVAPRAANVSIAVPALAPRPRRRGFPGIFTSLVESWAAAWTHRRDAELLRSMPDYLLRDIGLTRDDVRHTAALRARLGVGR